MRRLPLLILAALALACGGLPTANQGRPADTMPVRTFLASPPTTPCTFTLPCKFDAATAEDQEAGRYSVWMETDADPLIGKVAKDSATGKTIFAALKDGQEHTLTVKVVHHEGDFAYIVEILEVR
jgi:hypothetical protein